MTVSVDYSKEWDEFRDMLCRSQSLAVAGQFAAAVMHEINNPLEAAANLSYLIKRDSTNAENVSKYSALLEEQLFNIIQIARQTLSFYKSVDTMQDVSLEPLAEAALRVHEKKIAVKQIRLLTSFGNDVKAKVHAGEMLQVLSNLIGNAIDALPDSGTLHLRAKRCGEEIHLLIADDGHGIAKETLSRIFEPFFTTKKERGTGLGLALSKAIVERHHGRIRGRSTDRPGRSGTTFRISLPLQ